MHQRTLDNAKAECSFGIFIPRNLPDDLVIRNSNWWFATSASWSARTSHPFRNINWTAREVSESRLERVIDVDAFMADDSVRRTFLGLNFWASDMSLELLQVIALVEESLEDVNPQIGFYMLFDEVEIYIQTSSMTPEEVWEIVKGIIDNYNRYAHLQ
jgi:hypothetical protein